MIGILSLKKSYGRQNGKMLYKFFPKDESPFLVPYSIKSSFSKANEDLYVICENRQANTQTKYDIGAIKHCIGSVNDLHAYYEYELYRKNLIMGSNTFFQKTKNIDFEPDKGDEDRFIFTIDSATTTDFDDAISIHYEESCPVISVYISNVPYIMEKFGLWAFVEKVSTVYLPDKKRGMLPYPLENACSLKEGCYRHVYVMEIRDTITFSQKCVKISKNYIYEEPSLKTLKHYKRILSLVQDMATRLSFDMEIPRDSYGLIVYLMIFMNYQCAMKLENGIFRKVTKMVPREQPYIFATWMNWFGEYVCEKTEHEMLGVFYTHVTSPIRRLVDIVNLAILQNIGSDFCIKWLARIDFINEKTKSIKKVQRNCELMKQCIEGKKEYDAFGMENCIYIPELKMLSKPIGVLGNFRVNIAIVENKEAFKKVKFFVNSI